MSMKYMRFCLSVAAVWLCWLVVAAQDRDWEPTGEWPFLRQQFRVATVYHGIVRRSKTVVPCNIHVRHNMLWYSQNDTLMEAEPGGVVMVEFGPEERYMPVGRDGGMGRIVREDSIDGRIARVVHVRSVDQRALDQKYLDYLNKSQNVLQGSTLSAIADTQGGVRMEAEPLPMVDVFYFQVRGEIFPFTTKNVLERIDQRRRKEYRAFTRSAEIISSNESSAVKVWREFFLK